MARNYGMEKARGEWITFQDGDDASLLNRIEVQYNLAEQYKADHVCIQWQQYKDKLLGKKLNVNKIFEEQKDIIISPKEIHNLAKKTKGPIIPFLGKLNSIIPFEFKRLRIINKLFFGPQDPYPATGNSPLFRKKIIAKVKFRPLKDRVWPSFVGRGADRDFNFQVAEIFKNSMSFNLPLYLWRQDRQNPDFENYDKYIY